MIAPLQRPFCLFSAITVTVRASFISHLQEKKIPIAPGKSVTVLEGFRSYDFFQTLTDLCPRV